MKHRILQKCGTDSPVAPAGSSLSGLRSPLRLAFRSGPGRLLRLSCLAWPPRSSRTAGPSAMELPGNEESPRQLRRWRSPGIRIMAGLVAPAVLLLFTACEFHASLNLSFSHVMRVIQSADAEGIPSTALIRLEMGSEEGCQENRPKVIEILSRYYGKTDSAECSRKDFQTFLEAEVPLSVVRKGEELNTKITSVLLESTNEGVEIRVAMDRGSFERMQNEMEEAFFNKPEVEDLTVVIRFLNDARNQTLVTSARLVYIDGKPLPTDTRVLLDPGRSVEIRLSDVARDYIYQQGSLSILSLQKTVEGKPFSSIEFEPRKEANPSRTGELTGGEDRSGPGDAGNTEKANRNDASGDSEEKSRRHEEKEEEAKKLRQKDFNEIQDNIKEMIEKDARLGGI